LILRDRELARDAVQEAYLRAWHDLPGLRDPERFDAWLHRLTVNACLDDARRRRRRPIEVGPTSIEPAADGDMAGQLADRDLLERGFSKLGTSISRRQDVMTLILGRLPATLELAFVALVLSLALGIPLGTAQSRLGRALAGLRDALGSARESDGAIVQRGEIA